MHCLVSHGSHLNMRDVDGCSPFLRASRVGRVESMGFLRECGCTVDARSNNGDSALHMVCQSQSLEALEYLLLHIPTLINSRNYNGKTPCDMCDESGAELLQMLQARGGVFGDDLEPESPVDATRRQEEEKRCEENRRRVEEEEEAARKGGGSEVIMPTE